MKVAIPTTNDCLDPHFGHCQHFTVYEISDNKIINQTKLSAPPHQPGLLPVWLKDNGISHVIAGGMGAMAKDLLIQNGVAVYTGAQEKHSDELIKDFLDQNLEYADTVCDHKH
ncbi:MAG: NifB/NifX family molybdenum-iron cluster-binding protein [Candidatus Cloacimonetes bacterium]|nr:NifB/NifX family molybdenum-iron cluster-binding protein [Candidatus Cloacimonadota bacterium]